MASDPPCPQKPYKVWNFDKTEGRIIAASKLEELQLKGNVRLMIVLVIYIGSKYATFLLSYFKNIKIVQLF